MAMATPTSPSRSWKTTGLVFCSTSRPSNSTLMLTRSGSNPRGSTGRRTRSRLKNIDPIADLVISDVRTTGFDPDHFLISGDECHGAETLGSGETCDVRVRFGPSAPEIARGLPQCHQQRLQQPHHRSPRRLRWGTSQRSDRRDRPAPVLQDQPGRPARQARPARRTPQAGDRPDLSRVPTGRPGPRAPPGARARPAPTGPHRATGSTGARRGPIGKTGSTGPGRDAGYRSARTGRPGTEGPIGLAGPQGAPGRDATVTCKVKGKKKTKVKCTVSFSASSSATSTTVRLSRGRTVARGLRRRAERPGEGSAAADAPTLGGTNSPFGSPTQAAPRARPAGRSGVG